MIYKTKLALILLLIGPLHNALAIEDTPNPEAFMSPPSESRPRVWWHWMNGNISEDGIRADLEWMSRIGIGGLQNFDAALDTPQIVDERLVYMSPKWQDAFRLTSQLASDNELELTIAASPGWSETGGPWVEPEDGMKKLVWTSTDIQGGNAVSLKLPTPSNATGAFQDSSNAEEMGDLSADIILPNYYQDALVLAVPLLDEHTATVAFKATDAQGLQLDPVQLQDGSYNAHQKVNIGTTDDPGAITLHFDEPVEIASASFGVLGLTNTFREAPLSPVLQARLGNSPFKDIAEIPINGLHTTISFTPVLATEIRLVLAAAVNPDVLAFNGADGAFRFDLFSGPENGMIDVVEFSVSPESRINRFEVKAGFGIARDYYALDNNTLNSNINAPQANQVINLSSLMNEDSILTWTAPAGKWRILRLGFSLTGKTNHPATIEATGLEVDKFDEDAVRRYLEYYLNMYQAMIGVDKFSPENLQAILTDSIEVGASNWTADIVSEFSQRRGYDPTPWLPTLTGMVIGSTAESNRFLYDYRQTLADMLSENHYGTVKQVASEYGLKVYGEALENGRPALGDDLAMRSKADVPMAALWTYRHETGPALTSIGDMKGASSVAHLYGQNLAAAESMTSAFSPWAFAPSDLKPFIDLEFVNGINRPIIHTSVHQPVTERQPGLSLLFFGQHFNRLETWAEQAKPWIDYISRASYLLQRGAYYADVAYFYGEEAPITELYKSNRIGNLPIAYAYDLVNADVLQNVMHVVDGKMVANSETRYQVLYLGGTSEQMTLPTLQSIAALAFNGATIIGSKPIGSPSLADNLETFNALANTLWGETKQLNYGSGQIINATEADIDAELLALGIVPDFESSGEIATDKLQFLHRTFNDGELYFVRNSSQQSGAVELKFRISGKAPSLWQADTGTIIPLSYHTENDQTTVPLTMDSLDSAFIVFTDTNTELSRTVPSPIVDTLVNLNEGWVYSFTKGLVKPEGQFTDGLGDWSQSSLPAQRYFSGTASYFRTLEVESTWLNKEQRLVLNMGKVGVIAEVFVNGVNAGIAWHAPFEVDVTEHLSQGSNQLEIRVTNLWVNRLIGDAQDNATPVTFTTLPSYHSDAPLRASGLIGPVSLQAIK